jgi:hypothetical protein
VPSSVEHGVVQLIVWLLALAHVLRILRLLAIPLLREIIRDLRLMLKVLARLFRG